MFSKKGTEMSVTVLVGIILGIAMLAVSLLLFFQIMVKTDKTNTALDDETRATIIQALDSGEPVFVPAANIEVVKNKATFWVGIKNINDEAKNFKLNVKVLPGTVAPNFDQQNIAFLPGPYNIEAKDNEMPSVIIDMKGVTSKITLLVNVSVQQVPNGPYVQYERPKIVYIQP